MATLEEFVAAYDGSRGRIDELTRHLGPEQLATTVPCCPAWSVKDLVGHLTGLLEDRRDARMPTGGFEGWTDEQVARHRDEPIAVVLDTWALVEPEPSDSPPSLPTLVFDLVTHEHDLFHALGVLGNRDTDAVQLGSERARERTAGVLEGAGAPGVVVTTEDGTHLVDGATPPILLSASTYQVLRLATGRMSRDQALGLAWDGDPGPVLDALFADGFFSLQPTDVVEADST